MSVTLTTWGGRTTFSYSGTVATGTAIQYGASNAHIFVPAKKYEELLAHFSKSEVPVGTTRDNRPKGSLGDWLKANVTRAAIASYVGTILVHEKYATVGSTSYRIKFS